MKGHVVGFLGDGINDSLALKAADVGISVDTAVDIAKESADIILLEKSLLVLHQGVIEGRKVTRNTLPRLADGKSVTCLSLWCLLDRLARYLTTRHIEPRTRLSRASRAYKMILGTIQAWFVAFPEQDDPAAKIVEAGGEVGFELRGVGDLQLHFSSPSVSGTLIERRPDPEDRRAKRLFYFVEAGDPEKGAVV